MKGFCGVLVLRFFWQRVEVSKAGVSVLAGRVDSESTGGVVSELTGEVVSELLTKRGTRRVTVTASPDLNRSYRPLISRCKEEPSL